MAFGDASQEKFPMAGQSGLHLQEASRPCPCGLEGSPFRGEAAPQRSQAGGSMTRPPSASLEAGHLKLRKLSSGAAGQEEALWCEQTGISTQKEQKGVRE